MVDCGNQVDSYGSSPCVNTDLLYHLYPEIIVAGHRNIHSQSSPELIGILNSVTANEFCNIQVVYFFICTQA